MLYNLAGMAVGISTTWGCSSVVERALGMCEVPGSIPRHLQGNIFQAALHHVVQPMAMTDGISTTWGSSAVVERALCMCEVPGSIPRHLQGNIFQIGLRHVVQPSWNGSWHQCNRGM